jgi:hypothetical protein
VKEVLIALGSVLTPALIAYVVYIYRPSVGFETQGANAKFSVEDGKIIHSEAALATTVEVGSIRLRNATRADIEDFEIVFERDDLNSRFSVCSTKMLATSAVSFRYEKFGTVVSIKRFPAKEEIDLEYSVFGGWGLKYVKPKRISGKFSIYSISDRRDFAKFAFFGAFFTLLAMCVSASLGIAVRYFGEGL